MGCSFQVFFKRAKPSWVVPFYLYWIHFLSIHIVNLYNIMISPTSYKKSGFIITDWWILHLISNLSIAFHAFPLAYVENFFSLNEILLPRYMNYSNSFKGLPLVLKMYRSYLNHMKSVLFAFTQSSMLFVAFSWIYSAECSRFTRSIKTSAYTASLSFFWLLSTSCLL